MSRTVAALYSTRAEAETAQARLRAQLPTQEASVLGASEKQQLANFNFQQKDRATYEDALAGGDYLVCARVASGQDPDRIVRILASSVSASSGPTADASSGASPELQERAEVSGRDQVQTLFVGAAWIACGGAQVSYSGPEGERHKVVRSPFCPQGTARLEEDALKADGLFQNRTVEVSEMGEVPLISRSPVIREELVIHRAAEEHTEVIRGTVRRTVADVTDLKFKAGDGQRPMRDRT